MTTDWNVLTTLKEKLLTELPEYFTEQTEATDLLYGLEGKQVVIDDYDIDNLPAKVSIFICPSYSENARDTVASDTATYNIDLYCICKGLSKANLVRQAQAYKAAIEHMIGVDQTLGGIVDLILVESSNWFSGVEGIGVARGFKLSLQAQWQKIY